MEEEGLLREEVVLGVVYLVFSPCMEKTKEMHKRQNTKPKNELYHVLKRLSGSYY